MSRSHTGSKRGCRGNGGCPVCWPKMYQYTVNKAKAKKDAKKDAEE